MCTSVLLRTFNSVRWRRSVCSSRLWIFLRSAPVSSPYLTNMAWLSLAKTRCWKCSGREMWLQPAVWRETPMTQVWTLTWTLLHSTVTELRLTCVSCVSSVECSCAVTVTVGVAMHHMALSSDELTLSVCGMGDTSELTLDFYDVRTFLNKVIQLS